MSTSLGRIESWSTRPLRVGVLPMRISGWVLSKAMSDRLSASAASAASAAREAGPSAAASAVLPVCDMLYDTLFYSSKIKPHLNPNGKWPLGTAIRPSTTGPSAHKYPLFIGSSDTVPQSVTNAIAEFTASESMRLNLPLVSTHSVTLDTVHAAWDDILGTCTGQPEPCHIPISTVEHESSQLTWHRCSATHPTKVVSLCRWENDCQVLDYPDNQGPLPVYLSASEQDKFDATGIMPDNAYFCLLCIRRDAQVICTTNRNTLVNSALQTGRQFFAVPPFQNLVDVMGGYHRSALGVNATEQMVMPVNIVGVSGALRVRYDSVADRFYIDQGAIVYGAPPLNGQAAA
jgi:hypothetical protein